MELSLAFGGDKIKEIQPKIRKFRDELKKAKPKRRGGALNRCNYRTYVRAIKTGVAEQVTEYC
jgi:ribosomal protein L19E